MWEQYRSRILSDRGEGERGGGEGGIEGVREREERGGERRRGGIEIRTQALKCIFTHTYAVCHMR